jgi:hypothetical protein
MLIYINLSPVYTTLNFWYRTTFLALGLNRLSKNQKSGTGTNFIRAVPKIERSVNGALKFNFLTKYHSFILNS